VSLTGSDTIDRNLRGMLEGFGSSSVVYGTQSTRGLFDKGETVQGDASGDFVRLQRRTLTVRAAAFLAEPLVNGTMVIDGDSYLVRGVRPTDDGLIWEIDVVEV
jgi:hypothetical protein